MTERQTERALPAGSAGDSATAATAAATATAAAVTRAAALRELLAPTSDDRTACTRQVVVEASRAFVRWLDGAPRPWPWPRAAVEIEGGLAALLEAHAWRGSVARWVDVLRAAFRATPDGVDLADALREEIGLFVWAADGLERAVGGSASGSAGEPGDWDGRPFSRGSRLADPDAVAREALARLDRGSVLLVPAYDDLVARALEAAQGAGLEPSVIVGEGGADGSGKWLARRLARAGVRTTLVYDAALPDKLAWADRVWSGTEAIGAGACIARLGCRRLFELAREEGVPVDVFATVDDLVPGGELVLPSWCERDSWLLWEDGAQGVELESQLFERVSTDAVEPFLTDLGAESAAALALRGMRTEAQGSLLERALHGAHHGAHPGARHRTLEPLPTAHDHPTDPR